MRDFAKAGQYIENFILQNPKNSLAWGLASRIYLFSGNEERGIQYIEKALQLDKRNRKGTFTMLLHIGAFYANKGDYTKAIELINRFIDKDHTDPVGWMHLGLVYYKMGDPSNIMQAAKKLIYFGKKSSVYTKDSKLAMVGLGHFLMGDFEKALKKAESALKSDNNSHDGFITLALAHYGKGNYIQAYETFLKAQELQPFDSIDKPLFLEIFETVKQHHEHGGIPTGTATIYCVYCGATNQSTSDFCTECGKRLAK
jgi:tetratricopeptide (TPR) repeat protein